MLTLAIDFLFKETPNGSYLLFRQIPIGFQSHSVQNTVSGLADTAKFL